jgi:hypothetical protein
MWPLKFGHNNDKPPILHLKLIFSIPKCFQNTRIKGVSQTQRCDICNNTILHWKGHMFRLYLTLEGLKMTQVESKHVALPI